MNATVVIALAVIAVSGLFDMVMHVAFKRTADGVGIDVTGWRSALQFGWGFVRRPAAWLAIASSVLSLLLFMFALTIADLSFAFSVDSVHHVFIAIASAIYLKERVTWRRWLGTLIIMLGILLVAMSGAG